MNWLKHQSTGVRFVIFLGIAVAILGSVSLARGPAPTSQVAASQPTVIPTATPPPSKDGAVAIDPRQLDADRKGFVGRNVTLTGRLLNVTQRDGYTWTQLMAEVPDRPGMTESMAAYWRPGKPSVLKGDRYQVWAIVRGEETSTREMTGATVKTMAVDVYADDRLSDSK